MFSICVASGSWLRGAFSFADEAKEMEMESNKQLLATTPSIYRTPSADSFLGGRLADYKNLKTSSLLKLIKEKLEKAYTSKYVTSVNEYLWVAL